MRKIIAIVCLLVAVGLYFFLFLKPNNPSQKNSTVTSTALTPIQSGPTGSVDRSILFVPYWTTDSITPGFSTYVYFGVSPNDTGINTIDPGYTGIPAFVAATQGDTTFLTVSILNKDLTAKILQNTSLQEDIIQDTLQVVDSYGFDGVVLDLEYSGLAFPSVTKSITDFSTRFAKETKARNLAFYQTLYGDTFYLGRPYDARTIAQQADGIYVLAYDFHKANGTPGPNFPLLRRSDADYDFTDMTNDFLKKVDAHKISIIFGMFGYDWTVDDKNRSEKSGESFSDLEIQKKFLAKCSLKNCKITRDPQTREPSVSYTDSANGNHVLWFEDMQSVGEKEKILQEKRIPYVGVWANGYF